TSVCFTSVSAILSSYLLFTAPSTTYTYTLSLHDALPIFSPPSPGWSPSHTPCPPVPPRASPLPGNASRRHKWTFARLMEYAGFRDRKSTRLNSSHVKISYAVFCLKKKNKKE